VFVRLQISPARIKLVASNFARWVVHGRPGQGISHFGELFSPRSPKSDESAIHQEVKFRVGIATVIVSAGNTYDRHVWITSISEDGRTC